MRNASVLARGGRQTKKDTAARATGPTLVSLFSGAGGLDLGLEQAGFTTLLANELEPYGCESLRSNRLLRSLTAETFEPWVRSHVLTQRCYKATPQVTLDRLRSRLLAAIESGETYLHHADIVERDVRLLSAEEVLARTGLRRGALTLMAGGPPCQPFSRAGRRELVDCDMGQLFMEFVRLVDGVRPRWFLFENVKGLVIHKADVARLQCPRCGEVSVIDFNERGQIKEATRHPAKCAQCGFDGAHSVTWKNERSGSLEIIEAEFRRLGYRCASRVLNAADFGAAQVRERLFIIGSRDGEPFHWPEPTHADDVSKTPTTLSLFASGFPIQPWRSVREELFTGGHWRYGKLSPKKAVLWVKNVVRPHDEPVAWTLDRPAPTIGAHQSAKLAIAPLGVPAEQLARQQWHVLGKRQGDTAPVFVEHEYLTDEELLRLQTFPLSWYLHGTRMQRAFQIGNAVPPVLARAVGGAVYSAAMGSGTFVENEEDLNAYQHAASV
jgi:DNA (cytosine-5)-methyltransferase 1